MIPQNNANYPELLQFCMDEFRYTGVFQSHTTEKCIFEILIGVKIKFIGKIGVNHVDFIILR